jgi:predicted metal-dependent hydrolase
MSAFVVDELCFELRRSRRRSTLQDTVDRFGELVLSAPEQCDTGVLERFVRERRFWIYTKLAAKEAQRPAPVRKEFVNGEGFPYLGRSYRLLLVDEQAVPLKLTNGRFQLDRRRLDGARSHFVDWYASRGREWLEQRVGRWVPRVGRAPRDVRVQDLGFRWGSCGSRGDLNLHWATIVLLPPIIDYILVHELVHLHESRHTPEFWQRLGRVVPDYESKKRWLAENGGCSIPFQEAFALGSGGQRRT